MVYIRRQLREHNILQMPLAIAKKSAIDIAKAHEARGEWGTTDKPLEGAAMFFTRLLLNVETVEIYHLQQTKVDSTQPIIKGLNPFLPEAAPSQLDVGTAKFRVSFLIFPPINISLLIQLTRNRRMMKFPRTQETITSHRALEVSKQPTA